MSAIITENFRRNNAQLFLNDIAKDSTTSEYYLGIGKQDVWSIDEDSPSFSVPVAIGSRADELEVLNNLSTLVALKSLNGAVGRVVPAVTHRNVVYKAYSSYDSSCFYPTGAIAPCYVTIAGAIFMCLRTPGTASATAPSVPATNKYAPFSLDGYVWVLVQETSGTFVIRTNTFTDVKTEALTIPELTASTTDCGGLITGFTVVQGGTGYNANSVFKLRRNGRPNGTNFNTDTIDLTATVVSGVVTAVNYNTPAIPASWVKGATFASVDTTGGGSGAIIVPTIAPKEGFAYIPSNVMPSWFAGMAVKLNDSIEGDNFFSRYRQISVIKNAAPGTNESTTLQALRSFTFANGIFSDLSLPPNATITNEAGELIGFADHVINTNGNKRIFFHQNNASGYRQLPATGTIKINGVGSTYAYTSIEDGEFINDGKAEVLFTENRSFITRAPGQLEDLILIIQF